MLNKPPSAPAPPPERQRLPSVPRAAASPSAIVLAGGGAALGELAHLPMVATVALAALGYGSRLGGAALHRRAILRRRRDPASKPARCPKA